MKVLIDTQVLLWILAGHRDPSARAREVYLDAASALYFSLAGYWEICVKNSLGKLKLSENWPRTLKTEMHRIGIRWMPILPRHCERIVALRWIHREDPSGGSIGTRSTGSWWPRGWRSRQPSSLLTIRSAGTTCRPSGSSPAAVAQNSVFCLLLALTIQISYCLSNQS